MHGALVRRHYFRQVDAVYFHPYEPSLLASLPPHCSYVPSSLTTKTCPFAWVNDISGLISQGMAFPNIATSRLQHTGNVYN